MVIWKMESKGSKMESLLWLREVGARDAQSEVGTREFSSQRKPQAVTGFWQALAVMHMTHSVVQNTAEL